MLKVLWRLVLLGVLTAIAVAIYRKVIAGPSADTWAEPVDLETLVPVTTAGWVEPNGGSCPASHPIRAKLASGIFHSPGGRSYERTNADRCYVDAAAAEADGLRPAKH